MSYQTFRRWYNKLSDEREIIPPTISLIKSYEEANRFEVAELTQVILSETNHTILKGRLGQLETISREYKVANIPNVMNSLSSCLGKKVVQTSVKLFDLLMNILCNIF